MIKFLFGILIATCLIIFAPEIKDLLITTGFRDFLVNWLESWTNSGNSLIDISGNQNDQQ